MHTRTTIGACSLVLMLGMGAAACPSASECEYTLDCGPFQSASASTGSGALGQVGDPCEAPGDCANGQCVDLFCCDSECGGSCEACNVAGNEGSCIPVPSGEDPDMECGADGVCDGASACASGSCLWSRRFGSDGTELGPSLAVDADGNVFLAGHYTGFGFGFGCPFGEEVPSVTEPKKNFYVTKLDSDGNCVWVKGGLGVDALPVGSQTLATDHAGAVLVAGSNYGTYNFGGDDLTNSETLETNMFVAKLASDGSHVWSKGFDAPSSQSVLSVAADDANDVYMTGYIDGQVVIGGDTFTADGQDVFITKLDGSSGNPLWTWHYPGTGNQSGQFIRVLPDGGFLLAGQSTGTVSFDKGQTSATAPFNRADVFVVRLDLDGDVVWSHQYGETTADVPSNSGLKAAAIDSKGSIVLTGSFDGVLNVENVHLTTSDMSNDVYVIKLESDGSVVWAIDAGDAANDQDGLAISTDSNDNVIVSGEFYGALDFDGAGGQEPLFADFRDAFVAKFSADGSLLYQRRFGNASIHACTVFADRTLVAGTFATVLTLGCQQHSAMGPGDMFLGALSP